MVDDDPGARARCTEGRERKRKPARKAGPPAAHSEYASADHLGAFLKRVRVDQSLSQFQLAALTEGHGVRVSRSEISALERGEHLPRLDALVSISLALRLNPTELLDRVRLASPTPIDLTGLTLDQLEREAEESFWAGRFRDALSALDAMADRLALAPPENREEQRRRLALIELRRGGALRRAGALLTAREAAERALCASEEWPEIAAQSYTVLSEIHLRMGHAPLALDAAARAVEVASGCDDKIRGRALISRGRTLLESGRAEEARSVFIEARRLARESGDAHHMVHLEGNIGACERQLGRLIQAERWISRAVRQARLRTMPAHEAQWLVSLGRVAFERGDLEKADRSAAEALGIARRLENWLIIFRGEWLRHRVAKTLAPDDNDRRRLTLLRKLHRKLREHGGEEELKEFEAAYVRQESRDDRGRRAL